MAEKKEAWEFFILVDPSLGEGSKRYFSTLPLLTHFYFAT